MSLDAPAAANFDEFLKQQQGKDVLRLIACGSVDDGKSTLIGRLIHDTQQLFDDQLSALERDSRRYGTQGDGIDFALLVDGLAAEREQGITIDVAYRFLSTSRRTFILADCPGHEQYTRNMATGASTADLAVLLIDARKGLTTQTRRHSLLVSMLGIKRVVIAINKMDLVGWSHDRYEGITAQYRQFAAQLGFREIVSIPLSALSGDNVVHPAVAAPWYSGPTLLRHLEEVEIGDEEPGGRFRMPVQLVTRPRHDFRGYGGLIAEGNVAVGDRIRVEPSGRETSVARIVTFEGDLDRASVGQSVTIVLADEVDVSRGDMLADVNNPPFASDALGARLFWISEEPLELGASYLLKLGTATVNARLDGIAGRNRS